jgi:triacylglycerol lipase
VRARIRSRTEQRDGHPDCFTAACQCDAVAALQAPLPASVPQIAIYTKTDGIVDWRSCINDDAQADVEVSGTHVGLAWNPKVYRIIAERLAGRAAPTAAGTSR